MPRAMTGFRPHTSLLRPQKGLHKNTVRAAQVLIEVISIALMPNSVPYKGNKLTSTLFMAPKAPIFSSKINRDPRCLETGWSGTTDMVRGNSFRQPIKQRQG